jgi:hypothetical protein
MGVSGAGVGVSVDTRVGVGVSGVGEPVETVGIGVSVAVEMGVAVAVGGTEVIVFVAVEIGVPVTVDGTEVTVFVAGMEPVPPKYDNNDGDFTVSPINGKPNISSQVLSAEKCDTGLFPAIGLYKEPDTIEGAISTLGTGFSSSNKMNKATCPLLYSALFRNGSIKFLV